MKSWCGLCGVGPLGGAEMAEHYHAVHIGKGQPAERFPPRKAKPKPERPELPAGVERCSECGLPLLKGETGRCGFCTE